MTTSFEVDADPTCDNPAHTETLHVGNSAGGWKFSWHAYPHLGLTSRAAWEDYLATRVITSESGQEMSLVTFLEYIEVRGDAVCAVTHFRGYHDDKGHDMFEGSWS